MAKSGIELQNDNDDPDSTHKSRNHGVGHQPNEIPQLDDPEDDLKNSSQYDGGQN